MYIAAVPCPGAPSELRHVFRMLGELDEDGSQESLSRRSLSCGELLAQGPVPPWGLALVSH